MQSKNDYRLQCTWATTLVVGTLKHSSVQILKHILMYNSHHVLPIVDIEFKNFLMISYKRPALCHGF